MKQGNIYKPRYKVAFQAKSKIWPYKSSRLRRFFNIRGKKIVRRGFFKRHIVVFNNMKWTIARRYIRPAMRRRKAAKRRYRDAFYNKQQLRIFHGKLKENSLRKFFRRHLLLTVNRNQSFFAALERRVDIVFFRMRLLPTIFACHQYIHHYGILVNNRYEYSPNALVSVGDVISIKKVHWKALFWYMHDRIFYRAYGIGISRKRKYTLIKKKTWWLRRRIRQYKWFFKLRYQRVLLNILILKKKLQFANIYKNFLYKVTDFVKENENLYSVFDKQVKIALTLKKFHRIYLSYMSLLKVQFKARRMFRKKINKMVKKFKYRKRYRIRKTNFSKIVFNSLGLLFNIYIRYSTLHLSFQLEEYNFYSNLLLTLKKDDFVLSLVDLIKKRSDLLIINHVLLRKKIINYYSMYIRRSIRKYRLRRYYKYNPRFKKYSAVGNILTYFLVNRRYKKAKKRRIARLKRVHWAIPSYIHLDFRTMRGVFLYAPRPEEVHYSFKCSLTKISSFYKALGL